MEVFIHCRKKTSHISNAAGTLLCLETTKRKQGRKESKDLVSYPIKQAARKAPPTKNRPRKKNDTTRNSYAFEQQAISENAYRATPVHDFVFSLNRGVARWRPG